MPLHDFDRKPSVLLAGRLLGCSPSTKSSHYTCQQSFVKAIVSSGIAKDFYTRLETGFVPAKCLNGPDTRWTNSCATQRQQRSRSCEQ